MGWMWPMVRWRALTLRLATTWSLHSRGSILLLLLLAFLLPVHCRSDCELVGTGGCRGPGWSDGVWPVSLGLQSVDSCCSLCSETPGCTAITLSKEGGCLLFGHKEVVPVQALGGECYRIARKSGKGKKDEVLPSPSQAQKKLELKTDEKPSVKEGEKKTEVKQESKKQDKKEEKIKEEKPPEEKPPVQEKTPVKEKPPVKEKLPKEDEPSIEDKSPKEEKQPKEEKPSKDEKKVAKPKEEPISKHTETPKKATEPIKLPEKPKPKEPPPKKQRTVNPSKALKVGEKYVVEIGSGGCRGLKWNTKPWPVDAGRLTLENCAKACLKAKCTAFHTLNEEADGTSECFLFGNTDVVAVNRLANTCFRLADKPDASATKHDEEEEEEEELEITKPVYMALLGNGRCRGEGWAAKKWPILLGYKTSQECAEGCARKKGCTAFDLSDQQEGKFDCLLYGHKKVAPAFSASLPGQCFVLSDKHGVLPGEKEEEEEEEEREWKGEAHMVELGQGRCRGPDWARKKWPIIKGKMSAKACLTACSRTKGCTAFDISSPLDGSDECALYGHKNVVPASAVAGVCYSITNKAPKTAQQIKAEKEEEERKEELDDGVIHKFLHLGTGMCRGANWMDNNWPVQKGMKTLQECANACGRKKGCTAFDTSMQDGQKFDCMLYGHKHPVPASAVPGECYALQGAKYLEETHPEKEAAKPELKRKAILQEDDEDYTKIKDVELLGKGACRGPGWQDGEWPLARGRATLEQCAQACKSTRGCTAFDLSNKVKGKYDCFLLGHKDVLPASALAAKCYIIKGAKPAVITIKDVPKESQQDSYPQSGDGYTKLGHGLCRGPGWTFKDWPKVLGRKTAVDCAGACKRDKGCRAFDLSGLDGKKYQCFLFGHANIIPASALDGACYAITEKPAEIEEETVEEEEEEDMIIDLEGDIDVALLGKGGCRGAGWSENNWPKIKGFLTVDDCGRVCVATKGCTAFHSANPKEGEKNNLLECFLFGHKSIIPANALPGNCYTVAKGSSTVIKSNAISTPTKLKKKIYKIPKFEEPTVVEDVFEDDDEWLFDPPPPQIRSREHITQILGLDEPRNDKVMRVTEAALKDLKKIYETSIKDLEKSYKYRELSHRHFADPEIFNKPLIVLMGPWSGGKSTILNYLLGTEYTKNAFKTTAEPSPGFNFNVAMYGETEDEVDGTELAAEWAFSSLQKFGQEFLKKLRGKKMPNKLLEKATFAEIPGVLETGTIRKIDRRYPFNDACQWFIDHADLIVLVYDYAKLDIGPETEALLDQLKGRESQVRILLNKADEITAEELLKIQGNLVWNVSPLMASVEPPTLYAGSLWSRPYKAGAPKRLLKSQEQSLLKDIKEAIDKRVENRIATARRFAVRVRNHAKMVDCYLTTFNNNKGLFADKKRVAKDIIEHPHKFHIYEGISTLTNISRYDLPDPDTYKDFFNVHPLYDFPTLQSTCTFFRGCPLNKLDISIAYELPELLSGFKKKKVQVILPNIKKEKTKKK